MIGHIDVHDFFRVAGWIRDPNRHSPLEIELVYAGTVVATRMADTHRPDLEKAGLSDGRHGFDFDIPEMISLSERSKIGIRVTGTALYLEPYRSSSSMVQTLSRFGGLWIDQPDWIDTLAGKHRNGQFSDQLCDRLFHFVRDGYVVIRARCQWRYLIA